MHRALVVVVQCWPHSKAFTCEQQRRIPSADQEFSIRMEISAAVQPAPAVAVLFVNSFQVIRGGRSKSTEAFSVSPDVNANHDASDPIRAMLHVMAKSPSLA